MKAFRLKILAVELVSKSVGEPTLEPGVKLNYGVNFAIEIKLDKDSRTAAAISTIRIINNDNNTELANFKTLCAFGFNENDFNEYFTLSKEQENKYDMPVDLEIMLKSTGYSTSRGIVYSELKGTYISGAVVPLYDLATLIKANRSGQDKKTPI